VEKEVIMVKDTSIERSLVLEWLGSGGVIDPATAQDLGFWYLFGDSMPHATV